MSVHSWVFTRQVDCVCVSDVFVCVCVWLQMSTVLQKCTIIQERKWLLFSLRKDIWPRIFIRTYFLWAARAVCCGRLFTTTLSNSHKNVPNRKTMTDRVSPVATHTHTHTACNSGTAQEPRPRPEYFSPLWSAEIALWWLGFSGFADVQHGVRRDYGSSRRKCM